MIWYCRVQWLLHLHNCQCLSMYLSPKLLNYAKEFNWPNGHKGNLAEGNITSMLALYQL